MIIRAPICRRVARALRPWLGCLLAALAGPPLGAVQVTYVGTGAAWRFFPGTQEASAPDTAAWRGLDFDDAGWALGPAPFGYGDGPYGTDLSTLTPPMRYNYTTLFLRCAFDVVDPAAVGALHVNAIYDDGFVLWINGRALLRQNVDGALGDSVDFDDTARTGHETGVYEHFILPGPIDYLEPGRNVLAVQVLNVPITSSDLTFDLELFDPFGPDLTPPAIALLVPAAGAKLRGLTQINVSFSEEVIGVDAADLLVGGRPASGVAGTGAGPYSFTFPEPEPGTLEIGWAPGHGIADLAPAANAFSGAGTWSYLLDPNLPPGDIIINEFLASNGAGRVDEDGEASDWIELYNRGDEDASLAGWALTDAPDEPDRWIFPEISLRSRQYLVIFASGKDRRPADGSPLHTSFKLNAGGEYLALLSADAPRQAVSTLAPEYPPQRTDYSYGQRQAGGWAYFARPTPGSANDEASRVGGFVAPPECTPARGFCSGPVLVTIATVTPQAAVYYTLDGSEPTKANGTLYTAPLRIEGAPRKAVTVLRAVAFRDGFLPSDVATHTYLFADHVLTQPADPAGFPAQWGSGGSVLAGDYAMDARVVGEAAHAAMAREALTTLPTLAIGMKVDDLFSPATGIYANASREGVAWERPASAELIYPDGRTGFQIDCGIRIQGGTSTSGWKSPKLSMRLLFKDAYGSSKLEFPLYADSPIDRFDTLVLDAGLNYTWIHPSSEDQRRRAQYVRDQYVSDLQNAAGSLAPHGVFVNLYLDGLYWGVYDMHERPDHSFSAQHLGGDKSEYDVLRHQGSQLVEGNLNAWNAMIALARAGTSTLAQYEAIQAYLDVTDLARYMIVNLFVGNDDWAHQNWYASRRRVPGAGFRFFSWDAEHVLKSLTIDRTGVSNANSPAELYTLLRANAEFRLLFADQVHQLFFNGGPMCVDPAHPAWNPDQPERNMPAWRYLERIAEIDKAIVCESARWGDARRPDQPYTRDAEWLAELQWLVNSYFPTRSATVLEQFRAADLYPRVGAPVFSQHGGQIAPGFTLAMSLPAGTGGTIFYTLDGSDPRAYGTGAIAPTAIAYGAPVPLSDLARIRARTRSGTTWSALNEVLFFVPAPLDALRITEIMYNPIGGTDYEFIELTNTGSVAIDLSGMALTDGIGFVFAPSTFLAAGRSLVLAADPALFAARYPGVVPHGAFDGNLANDGERVTLRTAAGAVVASVEYDDDGSWPIGPDGFGYSLVLVEPGLPADDPLSWRASAAGGGTPGTTGPEPPPVSVFVNEILARSAPPMEDAIEFYNAGPAPVDLGGWWLSTSRSGEQALRQLRIPDGMIIAPGGYVVLYERDWQAAGGALPALVLNEAGGAVYLAAADAAGELNGYIVSAEYCATEAGVSSGRYVTSDGVDFTPLARASFGVEDPANIDEFRLGAGAPNSPPLPPPVVMSEIMYHPAAGGDEFLELYNLGGAPVPLFDAALGRGWRIGGLLKASGSGDFELPPNAVLPPHGYALVVPAQPQVFRLQHAIADEVPIFGPYGGALDNAGERLRLLKPDMLDDGTAAYVLVDQVRYNDKAPWPVAADGGGPSIERSPCWEYGNDPAHWQAAAGGSPGSGRDARPTLLVDWDPSGGGDQGAVVLQWAVEPGAVYAVEWMAAGDRQWTPAATAPELGPEGRARWVDADPLAPVPLAPARLYRVLITLP